MERQSNPSRALVRVHCGQDCIRSLDLDEYPDTLEEEIADNVENEMGGPQLLFQVLGLSWCMITGLPGIMWGLCCPIRWRTARGLLLPVVWGSYLPALNSAGAGSSADRQLGAVMGVH